MAYLVLARKYRPARFADVVGQDHVTRTLANAIRSDRVHHAYLFSGVRGLGKTTVARILAKCLVCETGPTAEPCDACDQCRAVSEGRSVDVIEIDGASNNSVDDVRSLREQVYYLPQSARRKIYIIDEVHMLSQQAFNALLKTLEEPPAHVTFLFATTDPHKVLPTILSRVSRLDLRRVRASVLVPYLQSILEREGVAVDIEGLQVVARCGEGSVRDSLTLLDKVIAFAEDPAHITVDEVLAVLGEADRYAIAELAGAILDADVDRTLEHYQRITAAGSNLLRFAVAFLQHLRDLYVVKLSGRRDLLLEMSDDAYEQLVAQAADVDAVVIAQHFDRFSRVVDDLEHSRVPRLVVEMGLLELAASEPLVPIGELVERLEAMEGGASLPSRSGGQGSGGAGNRAESRRPRATSTDPKSARQRTGSPAPARAPEQVRAAPPTPPDSVPAEPAREPPATETASTAPEVQPPGIPGAGESGIAQQLWNMVRGDEPPPVEPQAFELSGTPTPPPQPKPVTQPAEPQGDCPGSRCAPREIIVWSELEPFVAWEALLDRIRDAREELLFAVLADLGLSSLGPDRIELAAPKGSFAGDQIRGEADLHAKFDQFVSTYFGEPMALTLVDATPGLPDLPSLDLVEKQRRAEHAEAVAREVYKDPKIRSLVSTFSGEIGAVDPLGEPERQQP